MKNVIHTAGLSPVLVSKLTPEEACKKLIAVNAVGTVNMADSFYPVLEEGGSMVCFTSSAVYLMPQVPQPMMDIFFSVKDAPEQLQEKLLTIATDPGRAYMFGKMFVLYYVRMNVGRYGAAYEIANLIDFLCSYRASYISGVDILMDEGTQAFNSTPQIG